MNQLNELIEPVMAIAVAAGNKIKEVFHSEFAVEIKSDNSPVTVADTASNTLIVNELVKLPVVYPILSEEQALADWSIRSKWSHCWLVDPLDGTREFINKRHSFCINIGLVQEHAMVFGLVHVPMQNRTYYACRGQGAFVKNAGEAAQRITVQPWRGDRPLRIAISRSHPSGLLPKFLQSMCDNETVQLGSATKMCMLAAGEVDLYPRFGPTWEWDTAAAQCIVEEAGGKLTGLDFNTILYNARDSLKNPSFLAYGDIGSQGVAAIKHAMAQINVGPGRGE